MPIEIRGPAHTIEEFRMFLSDQLIQSRYREEAKVSAMDSGIAISYTKKDLIVSVHLGEQDDHGERTLYMECEKEIPELEQIWDDAIIKYGKELLKRLRSYSIKKEKVDQELRRSGKN